MSRPYVRKLHEPIYGWNIFLFVDRKRWARFSAKQSATDMAHRQDEAADSAGITLCRTEAHELILGIFDGEPGTLSHEAVHAANYMLAGANVKITNENDEALAYLVGWLVDECIVPVLKARKQ